MALSHRKRARSVDRDDAVDLLNAAFADGRLTAAEREDRVAQALAAKHLGELDRLTSDLQPGPSTAPPERKQSWWQRAPGRTKLAMVAAVLVVVGGGVALAELSDDATVIGAEQPSYVLPVTAAALEGLIAEQEATFGTTKSYGLSLQTGLSSVKVPTDDGAARYRTWQPLENGGFEPSGQVRGAGEFREFDLDEVDLDVLADNMAAARTTLEVPEPNQLVLSIQHVESDEEPRISITATNDYDEYGYLITDLGGEVITRHTFDPRG